MNLGLNISKNQECGTEGDFLSWSKVMSFSLFLFPVCLFVYFGRERSRNVLKGNEWTCFMQVFSILSIFFSVQNDLFEILPKDIKVMAIAIAFICHYSLAALANSYPQGMREGLRWTVSYPENVEAFPDICAKLVDSCFIPRQNGHFIPVQNLL